MVLEAAYGAVAIGSTLAHYKIMRLDGTPRVTAPTPLLMGLLWPFLFGSAMARFAHFTSAQWGDD